MFPDFLGILGLDSHLFQDCAKALKEQVEVRIVLTVISRLGMGPSLKRQLLNAKVR